MRSVKQRKRKASRLTLPSAGFTTIPPFGASVATGSLSAEYAHQRELAECFRGPLLQSVVEAYEEAWRIARRDCPQYFR